MVLRSLRQSWGYLERLLNHEYKTFIKTVWYLVNTNHHYYSWAREIILCVPQFWKNQHPFPLNFHSRGLTTSCIIQFNSLIWIIPCSVFHFFVLKITQNSNLASQVFLNVQSHPTKYSHTVMQKLPWTFSSTPIQLQLYSD